MVIVHCPLPMLFCLIVMLYVSSFILFEKITKHILTSFGLTRRMDILMKEHLLATLSDTTIDEVPTMTIVFIGFFLTTKLNPNQTKGYQTSAPSCPQC